eukprot:735649_1
MIITTHFYARNRSQIGLSDETRGSGAKDNNAAKIRQFHHGKVHTKSLRNGAPSLLGGNTPFDDVLPLYSCKNRERQEAQRHTHTNKPRAIRCTDHKVLPLLTIGKHSKHQIDLLVSKLFESGIMVKCSARIENRLRTPWTHGWCTNCRSIICFV